MLRNTFSMIDYFKNSRNISLRVPMSSDSPSDILVNWFSEKKKKKKKPWLVAFPNFCSINVPTVGDFKLWAV